MSLKEIIKEEFQVDLPISGGDGSSAEEAIIIDNHHHQPHEIEQAILENYFALKKYPWKLLTQRFSRIDSKPMDVLKVAYLKNNNTYVMDWYFDLTRCDLLSVKR